MSEDAPNADAAPDPTQYVVVARRYRPQVFEDLIGQEHVAQALSNAISTNRVGHAYLFTGARGVGKTSAARILAKALNCQQGPAPVPCNQCDICQTVSGGDDVDVLEIDGASNRGIDEIRQLRQNVNVRPSRSRFKIYIIDEVHMLTREAFNALLKTLEEPPEHVKFIFCTTEPTKIPITILSRCQRFDFAGIMTSSIHQRLRQIVEAEGVEADEEALEVLARRAAGSMRDSQSLLEQLLAFCSGKITLDQVHDMLGTAGDHRLANMVGHLIGRDGAAALAEFNSALTEGVDAALLIEQLLGYFRDCMVATVGCSAESFLYAPPTRSDEVVEAARQLGLETILAAMQILEQALARMRVSTQDRILAELALVRVCQLENLEALSVLIAQLRSGASLGTNPTGAPAARPAAGNPGNPSGGNPAVRQPAPSPPPQNRPVHLPPKDEPPPSDDPGTELSAEQVAPVWAAALEKISSMVAEQAREFHHVELAGPNRLVVLFKPKYSLAKAFCERPEQVTRFETALREVTGQTVRVQFRLLDEPSSDTQAKAAQPKRVPSPYQRLKEVSEHPLVRRAGELFGAEPQSVDESLKQKED